MKKNNFFIFFILIFFTFLKLDAKIIILSKCDHKEDGFLKNEYILDLKKSLMTRNYVYND